MKRTLIYLGIIALAGVAAVSCKNQQAAESTVAAEETTQATATKGAIVYFNLDKVLEEYDMANDLRSVVETKVNSIQQEVTRRGNKLQKDMNDFQDKLNKGLLTRSVAEVQSEELSKRQQSFQNYAAQKEQEIAEEQQVTLNQIADAIKTFLDEYNAEKQYAMILTTQGNVLPAPVAVASPELDITEEVLAGLNAAYVKTKSETASK